MSRAARVATTLPLSVVIATLGSKILEQTIQRLNGGTCIPNEILVCIPEGASCEAELGSHANLRIVETPCRGQVAQRAFGLSLSRNQYVMQLDDDVFLPEDALEGLLETCRSIGPGNAVAPIFKDCLTGQYLTRYTRDLKGYLQSIIAFLICGARWGSARMGTISSSGIGYSVDKNYCQGISIVEVEWVPGGCVMCGKADLVTENYFPFPGKAFSEDIIHSLHWRQRGVRLWALPNIACCTCIVPMPSDWSGIRADYRARVHVVNMIGGSINRCRLWFAIYITKQVIRKIFCRQG